MNYPHSPEYDEEGNIVSAIDWLGNRFYIGERVLYCISAGRGQQMAIGVVQEIVNNYDYSYGEQLEVRILTEKSVYDSKVRTRPAWVNQNNITSMKLV